MRSAKCVPDCSESSISMSKSKKMRGSEHFWKMKLVLVKCPRESNETVARVRFALQYAQESGDRSTFDGWGWQISLVDCLVYWFNDSLVYDLIHLYLQLQWYFITANDFERARSCQTYVSYWGTFMFLHVCPFLLMVEVDPYSAASQQRSWGLGCAFLPCQCNLQIDSNCTTVSTRTVVQPGDFGHAFQMRSAMKIAEMRLLEFHMPGSCHLPIFTWFDGFRCLKLIVEKVVPGKISSFLIVKTWSVHGNRRW